MHGVRCVCAVLMSPWPCEGVAPVRTAESLMPGRILMGLRVWGTA